MGKFTILLFSLLFIFSQLAKASDFYVNAFNSIFQFDKELADQQPEDISSDDNEPVAEDKLIKIDMLHHQVMKHDFYVSQTELRYSELVFNLFPSHHQIPDRPPKKFYC